MIFYSVHFNRPDFIDIQKKCIDRIGGTLVIINNGNNKSIEDECTRLGVKFYNYQTSNKEPSISHGMALNYLKGIIDYSDDWSIIDHDLFPIKKIDLSGYEIAGLPQSRGDHNYFWPGFLCGKKDINLSDIDFMPANYCDSGAGTSLLMNVENRIMKFIETHIGEPTTGFPQNSVVIANISDLAIHYLNGSSWMHTEGDILEEKNKKLLEFLKL
jgi:hypothetical protein